MNALENFVIPYTHTHWPLYWTPFCLQNCLNSSWHRFNKVLETFLRDVGHIVMISSHSCCRFVICTSMMWISRSTTSQRCSIGLRSGDCGGHYESMDVHYHHLGPPALLFWLSGRSVKAWGGGLCKYALNKTVHPFTWV